VKSGKKRRESSKRNYYIISPREIIKAIIIIIIHAEIVRGLPSPRIFMFLGGMKAAFVPSPSPGTWRARRLDSANMDSRVWLVGVNSDLYRLCGPLHGLDTFWARGLSWINKETTTTTTQARFFENSLVSRLFSVWKNQDLRQGWVLFETNVRIQWNLAYKAFHRSRWCGNETNC